MYIGYNIPLFFNIFFEKIFDATHVAKMQFNRSYYLYKIEIQRLRYSNAYIFHFKPLKMVFSNDAIVHGCKIKYANYVVLI